MKIIMLCSSQGNQTALAHKINARVPLHALALCDGKRPAKRGFKHWSRRLGDLCRVILTAGLFRRAWFAMLEHYDRLYPEFPIAPRLHSDDVNAREIVALIEAEQPDLVVVSGTGLLRQPLIDAICQHGKVMNLHTGISPYVKGSPNCTNWCLALREFDMIGNTVMWLDAGIDSGNLIATERTPITGDEGFNELHIKVMDHGHDLYVDAIVLHAQAVPLPSVPQDSLPNGRLFLSRHWTLRHMWKAMFNFHVHYRKSGRFMRIRSEVGLVAIPGRS